MEYVQKYWWIILGAFVLVLVVRSRGGQGATIQQISAGGDQTALAQIAAAERGQDESNRLSLIGTLLSWDTANRDRIRSANSENAQLYTQLKINQLNASQATSLAQLQYDANAANIAAQQQQFSQQIALQQAAINAQLQIAKKTKNSQNLNAILATILGGFQTLNGVANGGGGYGGTPTTFPVYNSGGGFGYPSYNPNIGGGFGGGLGGLWAGFGF